MADNRWPTAVGVALVLVIAAGAAQANGGHHRPGHAAGPPRSQPRCGPSGTAVSYSDELDKVNRGDALLGGLSSLAWDARANSYVAAVDNHGDDPSRVWFISDLTHPRVTRDPLVLKHPDGTPYTGATADDEGIAVLPDGDLVVSSETEPAIRIFGPDGIQKGSLPVPGRFRVAPVGQATANATLEGLTVSHDGQTLVAAMEGALSGDVSGGDSSAHRFLVYRNSAKGWQLSRQLAYRTQPGSRIPEVQAYGSDGLLVEEASFDPKTGNRVQLYAVPDANAPDVSSVSDLGQAAAGTFLSKSLVADVTRCPDLGATAKQPQTNPLMDNYEGMTITGRQGGEGSVTLISDDNVNDNQITRVLNLRMPLP